MIKAIIFDMDGLMIDSERTTYNYYNHLLKQQGESMSEEFYRSMIGSNHKDNLNRLQLNYKNVDCKQLVANVYELIAQEFDTVGPTIKPGLLELLDYLKTNNYLTMVATSSSRHRVDHILAKANLTHYFNDVICGDEIKNGKPAPDIFLESIKKLNIDSHEAYVLEDSPAGIMASFLADVKVIAIPDMVTIEGQPAQLATKILPSLNHVIDYLEKR